MVNLTVVVADGARRWDTTTHGYLHDPRLYTFSARTLRSLAPVSSTQFPAHIFFRSAILFLVYSGSVWRLAFFLFFPQRRMDSTVQAFSSHPPNFYFFSISRI